MGNTMKWLLAALGVLLLLYGITQLQQRGLQSSSEQVFDITRADVYGIHITNDSDSLLLRFDGVKWNIANHDSLQVKENTLNNFFARILDLKRTSLISKNPDKWDKFMVGDSTGTYLQLLDISGGTLGTIIVGRSNADWSTSNMRVGDEVEVFQTSENISRLLNTSPTYWGQVPPPPPETDSTAIDTTTA